MGKGIYSQFKTDTSLEKDGITLDYGINSKDEPVQIRIARAGGANQQYLRRMEAKFKPYRRQIQNDTIERALLETFVKEVYAETVVLGWVGVEDADGNPMACTKENCIKLFTDLPDLFTDIQEQSQQASLFRSSLREVDGKN